MEPGGDASSGEVGEGSTGNSAAMWQRDAISVSSASVSDALSGCTAGRSRLGSGGNWADGMATDRRCDTRGLPRPGEASIDAILRNPDSH
ncbi:MAG: hypothetical protein RIS86_730, partial [Planctomycetota bacterium]